MKHFAAQQQKLHVIQHALKYWIINSSGHSSFCHFLLPFITLEFSSSFRLFFQVFNDKWQQALQCCYLCSFRGSNLKKSSVEVLTKGHQLPFSLLSSRTIFPVLCRLHWFYIHTQSSEVTFLSVCVNILNTKFLRTCVHVTSISCSPWDFCFKDYSPLFFFFPSICHVFTSIFVPSQIL